MIEYFQSIMGDTNILSSMIRSSPTLKVLQPLTDPLTDSPSWTPKNKVVNPGEWRNNGLEN